MARSWLSGQVALFTGEQTLLMAACARRLAREGMWLLIAGAGVEQSATVAGLAAQYGPRVQAMEADLTDPESVRGVLDRAVQAYGGVDLLVHTMDSSGGSEDGGVRIVPARGLPAPLNLALTCTASTLPHLARRPHGHVLHLVRSSTIGAMEIEQIALDRIRRRWASETGAGSVRISAVYFNEAATIRVPPPLDGSRLLERYGARLLEEDDWAERVLLEHQIGDLVVGICASSQTGPPDTVRSYDFALGRGTTGPASLAGSAQ